MFCSKCGKENNNTAAFCAACGEKLKSGTTGSTTTTTAGMADKSSTLFQEFRQMRNITLTITAVILVLAFTSWLKFNIPATFLSDAVEKNYTIIGICKFLGNYGEIIDLLENAISSTSLMLFRFFLILVIIFGLIIIISCIVYLKTLWSANPLDSSNSNIVYGHNVMEVNSILLSIVIVFMYFINNSIPIFSLTATPYIMLGLALVNRFLILPKYNSIYYQLLPSLHKETNDSKNAETLQKGGWKCNFCGKVNPQYTGTCSCGNTKYENKSVVE